VFGWGRRRALLLAFLSVVALAVAVGHPSAAVGPTGPDERDEVFAAGLATGPEDATVRLVDDGRRWPEGRTGRPLLLLALAAVLVAVGAVGAPGLPTRIGHRRRQAPAWLGRGSLAPRAPPVLLQP
jgi:hypothetical protein